MSLRLRIVLLVLLATLMPAAVLGLYYFNTRESEIAQAKRSLDALARYAAQDLRDKVSSTVQLLYGLSRAHDLDLADRKACSAFLGEVLTHDPQYTGLLTILPDGQLHCDSLDTGRTLDLNDREYFKQAKASVDPAFQAVFGRLTGSAVLQIAFPARDARGDLKYVLLASLNLKEFGARFTTGGPHPGMEMVIWDSAGTVMARHPDDGVAKLAGTSQKYSDLYRFVQSERSGEAIELAGLDGTPKIWASSALPATPGAGLRIALGLPRAVMLAKIDEDLREALGILASVSLFAFLGALLFAEASIRRPVARITATAARQGKGDLSARIGAPYPRGELGGLMATLDATASSVQAHKVETERTSEELRRINRTLHMLSAINSTIVRVRNREELFSEACRIAVEEGQFSIAWAGLLDRESMEVKPVAWQGWTVRSSTPCHGPRRAPRASSAWCFASSRRWP